MNAREFILGPEQDRAIGRVQWMCAGIGVIGAGLCTMGALADPVQFFRSYLFAWLFWLGIALGCLALEMLQFLTGGRWGMVAERILAAAARTIPLIAILFLPLVAGIPILYPWSHPEVVAADPVLQHKAVYLNVQFFLIRAVVYFVLWTSIAYVLNYWAEDQYSRARYILVRRLSAVGLIIYVFSMTFAAVDWAESLEPHWYSTMWGFLFVAAQCLAAMAFTILVSCLLSRRPPFAAAFTPDRLHDLGKLLLMFVMLWAYFSFSQLLIIWSGNLVQEIPWYLERMATSWGWVGISLVLFQFALPFLSLLSRSFKRQRTSMIAVSVLLLVMRLIESFWLVVPDTSPAAFHISWFDFVAPIAIGGLWVALFLSLLRRRPLLPERDPRIQEVFAHAS